MLIESIVVTASARIIYSQVDKSMALDERAIKKYGKAFEKAQNARERIERKKEYANNRLMNVVNKKKVIVEHSLPRFIEVYKVIQEIQRNKKDNPFEISCKGLSTLNKLSTIPVATLRGFNDKQLACGIALRGITGMMVKESENKLAAANNTMRYVNVYEEQSESVMMVYDAIIDRADSISDMLLNLNKLFLKSIKQAEETIKKNGKDVYSYNDFDKGVLNTCVNLADAMTQVIDIPVVDEHGELAEEALKLLEVGRSYLNDMRNVL